MPPKGFGCLGLRIRSWKYAQAEKARAAHIRNVIAASGEAGNIRCLDIRDGHRSASDSIASAIAPAVATIDLREFVAWGRCWTSDVLPVLRPQTNLTSLHLTAGPWNLEGILVTDVPRLSSLVAPLRDAVRLAPGRPIIHLGLTTTRYSKKEAREAGYPKSSLSTGPITEFTMPLQWPDEGLDQEEVAVCIAQYLPTIEVLTLQGFGMPLHT